MPKRLDETDPGPDCPAVVRMIFDICKELEGKRTEMPGGRGLEEARKTIRAGRGRYLAARPEGSL